MHQTYKTCYTGTDQGYALVVNGQECHRWDAVALLFDAGANQLLCHGEAERMHQLHQGMQREALHLDPSGARADELVWIEALETPAHVLTAAINGDLATVYALWRRHRLTAWVRADTTLVRWMAKD